MGIFEGAFSILNQLLGGNPSLGGTRPQTPAEGRLRPPDLLQTKLNVGVSALGLALSF
jgi:hypothetical protein